MEIDPNTTTITTTTTTTTSTSSQQHTSWLSGIPAVSTVQDLSCATFTWRSYTHASRDTRSLDATEIMDVDCPMLSLKRSSSAPMINQMTSTMSTPSTSSSRYDFASFVCLVEAKRIYFIFLRIACNSIKFTA